MEQAVVCKIGVHVVSYHVMEGSFYRDDGASMVNRLQTSRKNIVSSFVFKNPSFLQNIGTDYPVSRRQSLQKWSPQAHAREHTNYRKCYTFNSTNALATVKNYNPFTQ
jgi:hypothetical protein